MNESCQWEKLRPFRLGEAKAGAYKKSFSGEPDYESGNIQFGISNVLDFVFGYIISTARFSEIRETPFTLPVELGSKQTVPGTWYFCPQVCAVCKLQYLSYRKNTRINISSTAA